jgi:5-methylcytosine-specific restriction endonuclease McrA
MMAKRGLRRLIDFTQRTLRSVKARNRKRREQNHKCASCGDVLTNDNVELDHIVPYRITKTTNPHDMQALCRTCNRKKG